MDTLTVAQKYVKQGLSVIPVGADKRPTITWKPFQGKMMTDEQLAKNFGNNGVAIGIVCGAVSGNLEVVDVDCKYDLSGTLFSDLVDRIGLDLSARLAIQRTPSGGYHLLYRCPKIEGNKKLAEREANEKEHEDGEKIKVLIETRGEGGYIVAAPSKGYEFIQNHVNQVPELTIQERDQVLNAARSLNQHFKEGQIVSQKQPKDGEMSVFEDYNQRADVLQLLVNHGWKIVSDNGDTVLLRRPGKNEGHSASYTRSKMWFTVFSSSTEFDQLKAYLPYAVFAVLECKGDFSECAKRLRAEGYGTKQPQRKEVLIKENIENYLSTDEDRDYLYRARDGKIQMGLTTGIPALDNHFVFKQGNFVVINGHDNTGKSSCLWYLSVLSAINHDWKWIIYSGENKSGYVKRKLLEFYYCKMISEMTDAELENGNIWLSDHYTIISNNDLYTYRHIIAIGEKLFEKKKYNAFLIDPYNSLFIEMDSFSKLSTHDYHYQATSEFRLFCSKFGCTIFLNCHAVTEALRKTYAKGHKFEGYPMPPSKADTEGGGKFSNRADDFITIHRMVQHPEEWMWTELHVRKVKETETGGHPTGLDFPVRLRMTNKGTGFQDVEGYNAITRQKTEIREDAAYQKRFLPYYEKDDEAPI